MNDQIFHLKENSPIQLLENVHLSFWRFKAKFAFFPNPYHTWCLSPLLYVVIG